MAKNTVKNTVQPGRRGGTLRVGNPGNKGGSGRPTDKAREHLEGLLQSPEVLNNLETLLKRGALHDVALWAKLWSSAWDKVKAKPPVQVEGGDERKPLTIRLIRE